MADNATLVIPYLCPGRRSAAPGAHVVTGPGQIVTALIVDDQELVRSGLTLILREKHGVRVVGECSDADEGCRRQTAPRRGGDGPADEESGRYRGDPAVTARVLDTYRS
ncbi:predicted protein [Mycolicibacterium canariasense]|uniref:Uncharacterized protein n=1 Tax=Mycolicibacterium canariasense TaxID=228230 RepID=A0A117IAE2_MYCCR|nr:hypothetical protein AWB94_24990 [Mycolicibacterium canariasense]GAS96242.1 predicted protein [Mycolicibacterium canariasense]